MVAARSALVVFASLAAIVLPGLAEAQSRHAAMLLPPVKPACISSPFGPRFLPKEPQAGTYHYGVDLPAPEGSPVLAAAPGKVIRVQDKGPGGIEMLVQHNGFVGVYSHFAAVMPELASGQHVVAAGQQLGVVGDTGITTGGHVYFAMLADGKPVDPAPFLGLRACNGEALRPVPPVTTAVSAPSVETTTVGPRKYYQLLVPAGR